MFGNIAIYQCGPVSWGVKIEGKNNHYHTKADIKTINYMSKYMLSTEKIWLETPRPSDNRHGASI